jgi:hypothetical protein
MSAPLIGWGMSLALLVGGSPLPPAPSPSATPTPPETKDANPDPTPRRLDLGAFSDPFGRVRYPDGDSGRMPEMPWFEEYIEVQEAAPRTIQEIAADWWKHWNIPKHGGPPTGMPTHKDLLEQMPGTPPPSVSIPDIMAWLMMTLARHANRETMPPIENLPPPPPNPELRVIPDAAPITPKTPGSPTPSPTPMR